MNTVLVTLFWCSWSLIFYAYVVFPLTLAIYARSRAVIMESPLQSDDDLPRVALVVSAYNEESVIAAKLANTEQIRYPQDRLELYIGSDGSSDGTNRYLGVNTNPRVHVSLFSRRRGKVSVINEMMQHVDADIVVMTDANTILDPDAVRQLVRHFSEPNVGCVSGELRLQQDGGVSGEGIYWRYENWIKCNESMLGFLIGCNGGIYAIRRSLYQPPSPHTVVDDFVISMRVLLQGYRVVLERRAWGSEEACGTVSDEMMRKARIGAGNWQALGMTGRLLAPRYGAVSFAYWGHKVLRWCVPLFFLVGFAACCLLTGTVAYRVLLSLQLLGAVIALGGYHPRIGRRLPKTLRPVTYFYLMNYALLCGFCRFVRHSQRVTWDRVSPASTSRELL